LETENSFVYVMIMAKRDTIKRKKSYYVKRNKKGEITDWSGKGRSLKADRRKKVGDKRIPKTKSGKAKAGYGHLGDYQRSKSFKIF